MYSFVRKCEGVNRKSKMEYEKEVHILVSIVDINLTNAILGYYNIKEREKKGENNTLNVHTRIHI